MHTTHVQVNIKLDLLHEYHTMVYEYCYLTFIVCHGNSILSVHQTMNEEKYHKHVIMDIFLPIFESLKMFSSWFTNKLFICVPSPCFHVRDLAL